MARDLGYRRNQWPAGVTLVDLDGRYAAIRIRPSGVGLRRKPGGGDWDVLDVTGARRARRPWVVRISRADGPDLLVKPFRPGAAGMPDIGRRVGRSSGDDDAGAADLGDNPVTAVLSFLYVLAAIVVFPIAITALVKDSRAARALRDALRAAATAPAGPKA